ncbi:MAG: NAD(P)H-dependent oxidoreductase [bacterium]
MELVRKLRTRVAEDRPIAVGIVGCGQMGSGLAHTLNRIEGMAIRAIADVDPQRGIDVFTEMGYAKDDILVTDRLSLANDAIASGKRVVTADALILPALDGIEANVEATGLPDIGALVAWTSVNNRKPVIMLNVETDITVGLLLNDLARRNNTVYTVASGDEPGVLKTLWEQAKLMGFEVVCLGKGKNNTINYGANEDTAREEATSKGMNPKILAAFQDGTKTMVELAAVSNATGVFAVVHADEPRIRTDMKFITGSDGPYYLQLRPYHLCDLETPQSVAEAVLLGERTITSSGVAVSEVVCVAKRDLRVGQKVEGIGGRDWYGTIMKRAEAVAQNAVPIGIGAGGTVTRAVKRGEVISLDAFDPDRNTFVYRLREIQESLAAAGGL